MITNEQMAGSGTLLYLKLTNPEVDYLWSEYQQLRDKVKEIVTLSGDDLCWRDIYTELASLVGVDFCPELMCDQDKFLDNCKAFDCSLRNGGPYNKVWVEKKE